MSIRLLCRFVIQGCLWGAVLNAAWAGSFDDFVIAIRNDDDRTVRALVSRGFDPNTLDEKLAHPLLSSIAQDSVKVARVLIGVPRIKLDYQNEFGENAMMLAALRGHVDLVASLIERGGQVNKPGWTPLHYAATGGHQEIIKRLLEAHAYIDAESPNGTTPLMMAARYADERTVRLLLDEGADVHSRNQHGLSALDFAIDAQKEHSAEVIRAHESTRKQ